VTPDVASVAVTFRSRGRRRRLFPKAVGRSRIEHHERQLAQIGYPPADITQTMRWIERDFAANAKLQNAPADYE